MIIEDLQKQVNNFVILDLIINPSTGYYGFDLSRKELREIRKLIKVEESGDGKFIAWLGQGVIMNMKTREILSGAVLSNDLVPMPARLITKALGEEMLSVLKEYFENQYYFINGAIL